MCLDVLCHGCSVSRDVRAMRQPGPGTGRQRGYFWSGHITRAGATPRLSQLATFLYTPTCLFHALNICLYTCWTCDVVRMVMCTIAWPPIVQVGARSLLSLSHGPVRRPGVPRPRVLQLFPDQCRAATQDG